MDSIEVINASNDELLSLNKITDEYISYLENLINSVEEKSEENA